MNAIFWSEKFLSPHYCKKYFSYKLTNCRQSPNYFLFVNKQKLFKRGTQKAARGSFFCKELEHERDSIAAISDQLTGNWADILSLMCWTAISFENQVDILGEKFYGAVSKWAGNWSLAFRNLLKLSFRGKFCVFISQKKNLREPFL